MIKEKLALASKLHNDSDRLLNLTMSLSGINMTFVNYGTFGSFRINAVNWCGLSFNINLSITKVSSTSIDEIVNDLANSAENIKISDIEVYNAYEILKHASCSSHDSYESCSPAFDSFKVDVILKYGAWPFEGLDSVEDKLRSKLAEFILSDSTFSRSARHLQRHVIARCMSPLKNTGKTTLSPSDISTSFWLNSSGTDCISNIRAMTGFPFTVVDKSSDIAYMFRYIGDPTPMNKKFDEALAINRNSVFDNTIRSALPTLYSELECTRILKFSTVAFEDLPHPPGIILKSK